MKVQYPIETKDVRRYFSEIPELVGENCKPEDVFRHDPPFVVNVHSGHKHEWHTPLLDLLEEMQASGGISLIHFTGIELTPYEGEKRDGKGWPTTEYEEWGRRNDEFLRQLYRAVHSFEWEGVFEINDRLDKSDSRDAEAPECKEITISYTTVLDKDLVVFQQSENCCAFITTVGGLERVMAAARKANHAYCSERRKELEKQVRELRKRLRDLKVVETGVEASLDIERKLAGARRRRDS